MSDQNSSTEHAASLVHSAVKLLELAWPREQRSEGEGAILGNLDRALIELGFDLALSQEPPAMADQKLARLVSSAGSIGTFPRGGIFVTGNHNVVFAFQSAEDASALYELLTCLQLIHIPNRDSTANKSLPLSNI